MFLVRLLIVGDTGIGLVNSQFHRSLNCVFVFAGVGKTSLLIRFHENEFVVHQKTTIGVDYKAKEVRIDGEAVKLQIWDTAGHSLFCLEPAVNFE